MILTYPTMDGMAMRFLRLRVLCWPNEEILETWFITAVIRLSEAER